MMEPEGTGVLVVMARHMSQLYNDHGLAKKATHVIQDKDHGECSSKQRGNMLYQHQKRGKDSTPTKQKTQALNNYETLRSSLLSKSNSSSTWSQPS